MFALTRFLVFFISIFTFVTALPVVAQPVVELQTQLAFPYQVRDRSITSLAVGSVNNLYLSLEAVCPRDEVVQIEVEMPQGFAAQGLPAGWQSGERAGKIILSRSLTAAAYFYSWAELLAIKCDSAVTLGEYTFKAKVTIGAQEAEQLLQVTVLEQTGRVQEKWDLVNILLPVDNEGAYDSRAAQNVLYVNDWSFESLRSRLSGKGAANLNALEAHPAGWFLLEIDNPARDSFVLRAKAELTNKDTGEVLPGLRPVSVSSEEDHAIMIAEEEHASSAMITLSGKPRQSYIIPLYTETDLAAGNYALRVTLEGPERTVEKSLPLEIVVRRNSTVYVLGFSLFCVFSFAVSFFINVRKWLTELGAKGVITVALFAAVAFGGITLPTTFLSDFLHVFLGPFAAFASGLLSGTFYYLLLTALFLLYPQTGTVSCLLLVRFILGALLLGRITPVGVMLFCTQAVILESFLYFLRGQDSQTSVGQRLILALALACADSISTLVNLELMIFFYRLYYASWYIWLYVLVCGFIYTAVGSWLGYALGHRLKNVTGE